MASRFLIILFRRWHCSLLEQFYTFYPGSEAWVKTSALFSVLVQSQIAVWSLKRMRHLCMRAAYGSLQKLSSWKVSAYFMISRAMKSHSNEHTVRGRPTLKDVNRFRNGLVCRPYKRSIYERTFRVNLSRIMLYQRSYRHNSAIQNAWLAWETQKQQQQQQQQPRQRLRKID